VGRSTFYSHLRDRDDLFLASQEEIVHNLFDGTDDRPTTDNTRGSQFKILSMAPHFRWSAKKPRIYRALMVSPGRSAIGDRIRRHLEEPIRRRLKGLRPGDPYSMDKIYQSLVMLDGGVR
jgi:AcrR family transcriptional regulator